MTSALGKGVVRAKDTPNFIANRVGIARHAGDDEGSREVRPALRRGRRPDRHEARPRQVGHLPHRRRGRPRHDGARHQDAAGQPRRTIRSSRSTRRRRARRADRSRARSARRPAPASTRRSARTSSVLDPKTGEYVAGGGKADEIVARILKKPPAERLKLLRESKQSAGAVPVGDPARQLPLHRRASGRRSPRARATSTSRCAGASAGAKARSSCWQARRLDSRSPKWVKEDIDAGKALCDRAAAGVGVRRPGRRAGRRAYARRLVERRARSASCRAEHAAGLRAPGCSARPCSAQARVDR